MIHPRLAAHPGLHDLAPSPGVCSNLAGAYRRALAGLWPLFKGWDLVRGPALCQAEDAGGEDGRFPTA